MKKMLLVMGIAIFSFSSCNRSIAVPNPVISAFYDQYPNVEDVEWNCGKDFYKADFVESGVKKEATFDKNGKLLRVDENM